MRKKKGKNPFYFKTHLELRESTGLKAHNARELVNVLKDVSGSVIYYHTHVFLQQHQFLSPEPPNAFAYWVKYFLGEEVIIKHQSRKTRRENLLESMIKKIQGE